MVETTENARAKIVQFIDENDISKTSMAKALGITKTYLNYILSGKQSGPAAMLWITKILEMYGI